MSAPARRDCHVSVHPSHVPRCYIHRRTTRHTRCNGYAQPYYHTPANEFLLLRGRGQGRADQQSTATHHTTMYSAPSVMLLSRQGSLLLSLATMAYELRHTRTQQTPQTTRPVLSHPNTLVADAGTRM